MHLGSFFNYLEFERRYSKHTLSAYQTDLEQLRLYLETIYEKPIEQAQQLELRSWVISLMENGISAQTISRKLSTLKSFYKFLFTRQIIETNPAEGLLAPKVAKTLPIFLKEEEMQNLFAKVEFGDGFPGLRDRLIIELLYGTGIRLSELINLEIADLELEKSQIKVLGKGKKERLLPISQGTQELIKVYLKERPSAEVSKLLLTDKAKALYPKFVYRKVKKIVSFVSTVAKISPHKLRHTFATHLVNKGADINAVKELLGHASLAATQVYTHNNIDQLKEVYKKSHPHAETD